MFEYISQLVDHATPQAITAAAALAAAILGPTATIIIGRLQVRASVRSANRHAWITALREDVAELMEKRIQFGKLFAVDGNSGSLVITDQVKSADLAERLRFLAFRIELRLHPGEREHDTLIALIHEAPIPGPISTKLTAEIKVATQAILRKEWKKAANAQ